MSAISFLAGLGAGYIKAKDKALDQDRQDAQEKRAQDTFNMGKIKFEKEQADSEAVRAAGAPVTAQEEQGPPTPEMVASTPKGQTPSPIGYMVGNGSTARRFASQGLADAEVQKRNAPEARRTRMADLAAQGNAFANTALTNDMQREASQMTINNGRRVEANAMFDQGIVNSLRTGGPQALAKFMSDSHADGVSGAMKFKVADSPDGKSWQMHRINEDGTTAPFGTAYPHDDNGYATAGLMLSRGVGDDKKLAHMMAERELGRKAKHDEGVLHVAQQNANTNEKYRRDQAALTAAHYKAIEDGKAKAGGPIQIGLKDMRDFEGDFNGYIKDQFPVKEGADPAERAALNAQATSLKALGSAMFQSNAAIGIPLTAGTVMQAMELGKDRKNVQIVQVNGVAHESVIVNGQHVITSGPLQKKAAPPAAGAPSAANTPAAAARAGVAAEAAPTPDAPKAPVRSIDGGKSWTLDVPETIRDPSVPYYRQIPNPMALALRDKTFGSRQEAAASFTQLSK